MRMFIQFEANVKREGCDTLTGLPRHLVVPFKPIQVRGDFFVLLILVEWLTVTIKSFHNVRKKYLV